MEVEFNCSSYEFQNSPPNVTDHLQAFGPVGRWIAIFGGSNAALLILIFAVGVCTNLMSVPWAWRRSLSWVTSFPMTIAILSLTMFLVPRAGPLIDLVKQSYMPFILMHFLDLSFMIDGGQEVVMNNLISKNVPVVMCTPMCCCFGLCYRKKPFTKQSFRVIRNRVYRAPVWQFFLTLAALVMDIAELRNLLPPTIATPLYQSIALSNVLVFAFGNWGFNVILKTMEGLELSSWNKRMSKAHAVSIFIALMKVQNFVLGLLLDYTTLIPCIPPVVSQVYVRESIDAVLSMAESLIFGFIFAFVYRVSAEDVEQAEEQAEEQSEERLRLNSFSKYI